MSRNNTGNPIGSKAFADFEDNVKNLDEAVNSDAPQWVDRLGRNRKTFAGMESDFQSAQERFNDFIVSSGYQFAGDYAPGIEITEYNQLIRDSNGEFWRVSGQVELPYVTTGAGIPEDDALVPAGDAVLRQDLADPTKGARLVGINNTTVQGFYGEKVSIESFGAAPGGDASDAFDAALTALSGTDKVLFLPNATYSISRTVRLDGLNVYSDGCEIEKTHNGVGIEIQGGPDYFDLEGTLYVRGVGAAYYNPLDNPAPPDNPDAHGVWFNGVRTRIRGKIISQNHQGDCFRYSCVDNMNKSQIDACWAWWGNRGHYFEGVRDDFSVCQIKLFAQYTWKEGIATSADFMGRHWDCFWYAEACGLDGTSHGVALNKLRTSTIYLYSENRDTTGLDVYASAECSNLGIVEARGSKYQSDSETVEFTTFGGQFTASSKSTQTIGRFTPTASASNVLTRRVVGRGLEPLVDHLYGSVGQYTVRAVNLGVNTQWTEHGVNYANELQRSFGTHSATVREAANGTPDAPEPIEAGDLLREERVYGRVDSGYAYAYRQRLVVNSTSPTRMSCSMILSLQSLQNSSPNDLVMISSTGDIELLMPGRGLVLTPPGGTQRYRLGVSAAGEVTVTPL